LKQIAENKEVGNRGEIQNWMEEASRRR
jgi:hypothetical protein